MGLFDSFRKKPTPPPAPEPVDANHYLLEELQRRLVDLGHPAEKSPQYLSLTVDGELELATAILEEPGAHPSLLHLMVLAIHPVYFPNGIEEHLAGIGTTLAARVESALDNYLTLVLPAILDSFSDTHHPTLDYEDDAGVLWHPKPGAIGLQGKWPTQQPEGEPIFDLLEPPLQARRLPQKLNWVKVYIARQADGSISGECQLNNEPWVEGYALLEQYTASWPPTSDFQAQKQFIMLRRCDLYDETAS